MSEGNFMLLPCPFCGGEADLVHYTVGSWDDPEEIFEVECTRCNASIEAQQTDHEAVEAWNRRGQTAKVDWMDGDPYCACGQELRNGFVYCPGCGAKLEWSE